MATTFTTPRHSHTKSSFIPKTVSKKEAGERGPLAIFVDDLIEDVAQRPLQAAEFAKHDMFHEHIIAMSVSYFTLIVLLIGASVPMLGYLVRTLVPY